MITKSDIKCVCNYTESSKPSLPAGVIHYLEFQSNDIEYQQELKRKNRELAIDALLDNKIEEFNERDKSQWPFEGTESTLGTVSMIMRSVSTRANKFTGLSDLYVTLLQKLETLTSTPSIPMTQSKLPTTLILNQTKDPNLTDFENHQASSRRVITRLMSMSSFIAVTGRIGPATTIICGVDAFDYISSSSIFMPSNNTGELKGFLTSMSVIVSNYITSNKVILLRTSSSGSAESGLNVINNINDNTYFMVETPGSWDKQMAWFDII